jgi:hypothetical protein
MPARKLRIEAAMRVELRNMGKYQAFNACGSELKRT